MSEDRNERWQLGTKIRGELMGPYAPERSDSRYTKPEMQLFNEISREFVFGTIWAREGLDRKSRALICVSLDVATHAWPELEIHLGMALRSGWTRKELTEALLHMSPYVGMPSVREAMLIASKLFEEER